MGEAQKKGERQRGRIAAEEEIIMIKRRGMEE